MAKTVKFVSTFGQTEVAVPGLGSFTNGEERILSDDDAAIVLGGTVHYGDGESIAYAPNPNFVDVSEGSSSLAHVAAFSPAPEPAPSHDVSDVAHADHEGE